MSVGPQVSISPKQGDVPQAIHGIRYMHATLSVFLSLSLSVFLSLSLSLSIFTHAYTHTYVYVYTHMYRYLLLKQTTTKGREAAFWKCWPSGSAALFLKTSIDQIFGAFLLRFVFQARLDANSHFQRGHQTVTMLKALDPWHVLLLGT